MAPAVLTISSRNYSSWSLRGWLLCKLSGIDFTVETIDPDDIESRQELLLLAPSFQVPRLTVGGVRSWAVMSIAEYLNESHPDAGLYPADPVAKAHCRSISGEVMTGFYNLRSALPMNLRAQYPEFHVFAGALADIERIKKIWAECLTTYGGPYLFGDHITVADAMYAPVATRFHTYSIDLPPQLQAYEDAILAWPLMQEWKAAALEEPENIPELEMEF
jgi:glutathione S-transferase